MLAAERGNLQFCSILIDVLTPEQKHACDKKGRNALALAIQNSHLHVADFLIQNGFDPAVKLPPPHAWNLLFLAVASKNDKTVEYCMQLGISPLEEDGVGEKRWSEQ